MYLPPERFALHLPTYGADASQYASGVSAMSSVSRATTRSRAFAMASWARFQTCHSATYCRLSGPFRDQPSPVCPSAPPGSVKCSQPHRHDAIRPMLPNRLTR